MSLQNKSALGLVVFGTFMDYVGATFAAAPCLGVFRCRGNSTWVPTIGDLGVCV